jgi:hypothetical protein
MSLDTSKVLDARRREATNEAYEKYAARRSAEGNAADDALMVDQGLFIGLTVNKG